MFKQFSQKSTIQKSSQTLMMLAPPYSPLCIVLLGQLCKIAFFVKKFVASAPGGIVEVAAGNDSNKNS